MGGWRDSGGRRLVASSVPVPAGDSLSRALRAECVLPLFVGPTCRMIRRRNDLREERREQVGVHFVTAPARNKLG